VLERDILPVRIPGYQPRLLDELGALGEVTWVGRGSLGRDDGRVVLVRPGRELLRPATPLDSGERPAGPRHEAIREHLTNRGASFYRELFAAAGGGSDREVLDALWDLVWAGEVTNDTFAPLRALRRTRPARAAAGRTRGGYSLAGPGAAQFALAGALERVRSAGEPGRDRAERAIHLLAAADPANPYGAAIPWPRRGEDDRRALQR